MENPWSRLLRSLCLRRSHHWFSLSSQPHLPPVNPAEPPPSLHPPSSLIVFPKSGRAIRIAEDKSLHKLATPTISRPGRPRVLIPDEELFLNETEIRLLGSEGNSGPRFFKEEISFGIFPDMKLELRLRDWREGGNLVMIFGERTGYTEEVRDKVFKLEFCKKSEELFKSSRELAGSVSCDAAFGYQREFLIHLELTETQRVVEEGEEEEGKDWQIYVGRWRLEDSLGSKKRVKMLEMMFGHLSVRMRSRNTMKHMQPPWNNRHCESIYIVGVSNKKC
ncbi:hypothetical protein Bca52824_071507 [Brassica carinata]|uniref:Uncharacterized protein n=1 Tax=Brassica carinata TaxID=52824 RepID=A0A8X7Q795_BRACI|nr:hypothetical protein Bca52824_071507 [Brassica carinata]